MILQELKDCLQLARSALECPDFNNKFRNFCGFNPSTPLLYRDTAPVHIIHLHPQLHVKPVVSPPYPHTCIYIGNIHLWNCEQFFTIVSECCVLRSGGGDDCQERWDGGDCMGGEHTVLGDCVERGRFEHGAWWSSLAAVAESRLIPARLHVYHVLRFSDLRELTVAAATCSFRSRNRAVCL